MNNNYDIAIIGAGPGGYAAAIRAAQLGLKACVIEKDLVGGTCLNWGCIPTKTISRSTELLREIRHSSEFGVDVADYSVDISRILKRKDDVVSKLRKGAEMLLRSKNIDIINSQARLSDANTIKIDKGSVIAKHIIIATGSLPAESGVLKIDHKTVYSSKDMLGLEKLPRSLVIIGGGFIGCEFASIYNRLGVEVSIIELMDQLLPDFDKEIARRLELTFKKRGINILKGEKVISLRSEATATIGLESGKAKDAEKILLCIGRRPNTTGMNLEGVGIKVENGAITTDKNFRTNIPNIYAIGDVRGDLFLAHVATYEGKLASEIISGHNPVIDYSAVPCAIFTYPEIASVGISADQAKAKGIEAVTTKLPFAAVSKAHILGETDGFIKLVTGAKLGEILGAFIFGPSASELISNFTIAIRNSLTVKDISATIFAHPTLAESLLDIADRV
jgi:dihydrolipoamide dehydrogenase